MTAEVDRGTLTLTSITDESGTLSITVRATDPDGLFVEDTFTFTVNPVNDAPSFVKGDDVFVIENAGLVELTNWATGISLGPANESDQTVSFEILSNSNPQLFSSQPTVSSTGQLSFESAAKATGTAQIELRIVDNGGTVNGGDDSGERHTINIHVIPQVITVTTVADENDGVLGVGGDSLREAIDVANRAIGHNSINFALPLNSAIDLTMGGVLDILDDVAIQGPTDSQLKVGVFGTGAAAFSGIHVGNNLVHPTVAISDITFAAPARSPIIWIDNRGDLNLIA